MRSAQGGYRPRWAGTTAGGVAVRVGTVRLVDGAHPPGWVVPGSRSFRAGQWVTDGSQ